MIRCNTCQTELPDDSKFCSFCGNKIIRQTNPQNNTRTCPNCNTQIESNEKFCINCGNKIENNDETDNQPKSLLNDIKNKSNEIYENSISQEHRESIKNSYDDFGRATEQFINDGQNMINDLENIGQTDYTQNQTSQPKPEANNPLNKADEIRKFYDLYQEGIITEEEFKEFKKDLLNK